MSESTQVNSGGATKDVSLTPDAGYIYQIIHISIDIPDAVGSTAGTHTLACYIDTVATRQTMFFLSSNTGVDILGGYGGAFTATSETPSGAAQQLEYIDGGILFCSNSIPLVFRYTNNLDANQTGNRAIKLWVKEYKEAT